jgi:hypothetical protein
MLTRDLLQGPQKVKRPDLQVSADHRPGALFQVVLKGH